MSSKHADTLYDHPDNVYLSDPASPGTPHDGFAPPTAEEIEVGDLLYDHQAPTLATPSAKDFYGHSLVASALDQQLAALWEQHGTSADEREAIRRDFAGIAKETDIPEKLLVELASGYVGELRADLKPVGDDEAAARQQALAEQITRQTVESRLRLRNTYGSEKDAEDLIQRTLKFVRSHPPLLKVMRHGGIGSQPAIVEQLVAHVFSTGFR